MHRRIVGYLTSLAIIGSVAANAYAVGPGFYMGVMAGPAKSGAKDQPATIQTQVGSPPFTSTQIVTARPTKKTQFASRFYLGYKMNPYAGFEGGFAFISKIKYPLPPFGSPGIRVRYIDLLGRVSLPLKSFETYAKGGVAITYLTIPGVFNTTGKNQYKSSYSPTFSLGASYNLNQSWVADISWNTVLMSGVTGNVGYGAIGLSYHFVDRYCGQFLCDD